MLTFCLARCAPTKREVDAGAEHEQRSAAAAVEPGRPPDAGPDAQLVIQRMMVDDTQAALRRGDLAAHPKRTLRRFIEAHWRGEERQNQGPARAPELGAGMPAATCPSQRARPGEPTEA